MHSFRLISKRSLRRRSRQQIQMTVPRVANWATPQCKHNWAEHRHGVPKLAPIARQRFNLAVLLNKWPAPFRLNLRHLINFKCTFAWLTSNRRDCMTGQFQLMNQFGVLSKLQAQGVLKVSTALASMNQNVWQTFYFIFRIAFTTKNSSQELRIDGENIQLLIIMET